MSAIVLYMSRPMTLPHLLNSASSLLLPPSSFEKEKEEREEEELTKKKDVNEGNSDEKRTSKAG